MDPGVGTGILIIDERQLARTLQSRLLLNPQLRTGFLEGLVEALDDEALFQRTLLPMELTASVLDVFRRSQTSHHKILAQPEILLDFILSAEIARRTHCQQRTVSLDSCSLLEQYRPALHNIFLNKSSQT